MERVGQTLNRAGHHGSGNATDLTMALVAVALAAAELVEVGKTKSFTQVLSYARIAPYSDLFEQGTLWKR